MKTIEIQDIKIKIKAIPSSPGCYIFKGEDGEVLYVGKALNLKHRVRSYFQKSSNLSHRISKMIAKTKDLEWIITDSELEALILECNLIKQHRPPYNVRLRDDKSYPFIVITKETFPRVMFTRKLRKDGSRYFGPYSSAFAVRDTLQLLHKVFKLIPCGKSWTGEPVQRPCLYYHMGRCMAPCAGLVKKEEYKNELDKVIMFLEGRSDELFEALRDEMNNASENLDFEKAAVIRDNLENMERVLERQKVLDNEQKDRDIIAVVKDERGASVQMFYVRGGKLIGQRNFMLDGASDTSSNEAVQEFVKRYYNDAPEIPSEILLPIEIEEKNIVETWLRQKKGNAVKISVPKSGEKFRLVEMAANNAELALKQFTDEVTSQEQWAVKSGEELQEALGLPSPVYRIEAFDISNIQGKSPVASMVVFENGKPNKNEYRRFKIKYQPESPDDFAMMREAILRRLRKYKDNDPKFSKLPDLIVIDGGRGQLNAAIKALTELNIVLPTIGLAKKKELIYVPNSPEPIQLPLQSAGLLLLRKLRDEAHRFAISYHKKLRDKKLFGSPLDEIPGIGPKRKRLLLRSFGSIEAIRRAKPTEIAAVPTMTLMLANRVLEALAD